MSALGVDDISARFAKLWRNFSTASGLRIEHAFDEIPLILQPAMLPAVITFPGTAQDVYDAYGEEVDNETRVYRCVLYVSIMGNMETGQAGVEPYIRPAKQYFKARPGLEDDTQVNPKTVVAHCQFQNDEGYIIAQYPTGGIAKDGQPILGWFHATAFNFEVETLDKITYKD